MREADLYIGGRDNPQLIRWWLIAKDKTRRFLGFKFTVNLYLHKLVRNDDDRALHDHPFWFISLILWRGYVEVVPEDPALWERLKLDDVHCRPTWFRLTARVKRVRRWPGMILYRRANHAHRLMTCGGRPAWTIVLTGAPVQDWGFYCPAVGWRDSRVFAEKVGKDSKVSRGCD